MNAMLDHFLAAIGFQIWTLLVWGTGLLINIALKLFWIKPNGIVGVASSSIVANAFIYICHYFGIRGFIIYGL